MYIEKIKYILKLIIIIFLFLAPTTNCDCKIFNGYDKKQKATDLTEKCEFINIKWWDNFQDPYLKDYIYKTIKCNHDLKKASWKTEEYRQFVKESFGKELPYLRVSPSYLGINTPSVNANFELANNDFVTPFVMQYEPDFLLKNRDKTKSTKKNYQATRFEEMATYISLVSDVGTTYINILKFDKNISLYERIVCINKEILKRNQHRLNRGVINVSEYNNSKQQLDDSINNLNEALKSREKLLNQLAVMIGDSPENINCLKREKFDCFDYRGVIPQNICSDLIFSRPDILAAESLLEKAKIDLRVAKKEFFPSFNIFGLYAFNTIGPGNFFGWEAATALLLAGATQDIFKGGQKLAFLRINKARWEQYFEDYKQKDLIAVQEVNDSLYFFKQNSKIECQTKNKLKLEQDNHHRNRNRYTRGVISAPDLLDSEKSLILVNIEVVNTKTNRIIDCISLYKAVGGKL